jgi:hypothetical protein
MVDEIHVGVLLVLWALPHHRPLSVQTMSKVVPETPLVVDDFISVDPASLPRCNHDDSYHILDKRLSRVESKIDEQRVLLESVLAAVSGSLTKSIPKGPKLRSQTLVRVRASNVHHLLGEGAVFAG